MPLYLHGFKSIRHSTDFLAVATGSDVLVVGVIGGVDQLRQDNHSPADL